MNHVASDKTNQLEVATKVASYHLQQILKLFNKSPKITLLVRSSDMPEGSGDFLLTDDNLDEAMKALNRLKMKDTP